MPEERSGDQLLRTDLEAAREITASSGCATWAASSSAISSTSRTEKNKKKVYEELKKEFRKDRSKITVLPMTEFGLVQITRQRVRQNILHSFTEPCPTCAGTGLVQSKTTTLNQLERWIRRFKTETHETRLTLRVNPSLASVLREGRSAACGASC